MAQDPWRGGAYGYGPSPVVAQVRNVDISQSMHAAEGLQELFAHGALIIWLTFWIVDRQALHFTIRMERLLLSRSAHRGVLLPRTLLPLLLQLTTEEVREFCCCDIFVLGSTTCELGDYPVLVLHSPSLQCAIACPCVFAHVHPSWSTLKQHGARSLDDLSFSAEERQVPQVIYKESSSSGVDMKFVYAGICFILLVTIPVLGMAAVSEIVLFFRNTFVKGPWLQRQWKRFTIMSVRLVRHVGNPH
jgi:hypothetical protein